MRLPQCHSDVPKPDRVKSYRICPVELQRTAVKRFAHILRDSWLDSELSSPSSSTGAHTQIHAHIHTLAMWGEGMETVRNLTIPVP